MVMKRTGIGARIAKGNPSISIFCIRRSKASSDDIGCDQERIENTGCGH